MSAENVAVVRSVYENFGKGDIPAVLAALDPEIEWIENSQEAPVVFQTPSLLQAMTWNW